MAESKSHSRIDDDGPLVSGARSAEEAARRFKDTVVTSAEEKLESSREYIRDNPMKTVLIAAGVGALVGFLVARRN